MEILGWWGTHWFQLLQTASITAGLFATAYTIRTDARERKIGNVFEITSAHRELWLHFYQQPLLHRVLETDVDLEGQPPTLPERRFVLELILLLRASFKARQVGMEFDDEEVAADIREFFSLPIPRSVWEHSKIYQSREFVDFVEANFSEREE